MATIPSPSFNDTIDGELFSSQVAEIGGICSLASEIITLIGGASSVVATFLANGIYTLSIPSFNDSLDSGKGQEDTLLGAYSDDRPRAALLEKWTEKLACCNFNSSSYGSRVRHHSTFSRSPGASNRCTASPLLRDNVASPTQSNAHNCRQAVSIS